MRGDAKERAGDKIARLAGRGLDLVSFWGEATEVLDSTVPHYWAPCWFTLDPASLLVTSHFDEGIPELPPGWLIAEYYDDDVNKLAGVARSRRGISTLHEATGGDPASSPRWHANMALGGDQELIAALRTPAGQVWGALGLYREPGQPLFDDADLAFVRAVTPTPRSPSALWSRCTQFSSTSKACSTRPGSAAAATSSAKYSSPTTNPACATTNTVHATTFPCAAAHSPAAPADAIPLCPITPRTHPL
jgi:hypothetical protein